MSYFIAMRYDTMAKSPRTYQDQRVTLADIERMTGVPARTLTRWRTSKPKALKAFELAVRATRARELLS